MAILDAIRGAWELIAGRTDVEHVEEWATNEDSFEDHFGVPYTEFAEAVEGLSRADFELYEKTMGANPEAAVVWVMYRNDMGLE